MTKSKRRRILRLWDGRCVYCGRPANTVEHIVPRSRGGTDDDGNLTAACNRCQQIKADRMPNDPYWVVTLITIRNLERIKNATGPITIRMARVVINMNV